MKKLLALVLILGMASMANAALTLSADSTQLEPSDYTTVYINSDGVGLPGGAVVYASIETTETGEWTGSGSYGDPWGNGSGGILYYGLAMDTAPVYDGVNDDIWEVTASQAVVDPLPAGLVASFEFHCKAEGDCQINLLADDLATVLDTITIIQQIPEPMTLSLLGLGGLGLLRRRRA